MSTALRTSSHRLTKYFYSFARCRANRASTVQAGLRSDNNRLAQYEPRTRPFSARTSHTQETVHASQSQSGFQTLSDSLLSEEQRLSAIRKLPEVCSGCGALSQIVDPQLPGHFDLQAKRNARFVEGGEPKGDFKAAREAEDEVFRAALERFGQLLPGAEEPKPSAAVHTKAPICDRCHMLRYQSQGRSIIHPSLESIQDMIEESPHKHNHIYHVVDAADFPMSLVPNLTNALQLPKLRTQNRRSKHMRFMRGRTAEVTFVITRSDLLAPKKEQVDALLPYLRDVLRDALGRTGRNVRLGNVRCVSAKRGWWTPTLKEEIWTRGGAGWMVGKVNVGKSALYESVFPKGRNEHVGDAISRLSAAANAHSGSALRHSSESALANNTASAADHENDVDLNDAAEEGITEHTLDSDSDSLLPPARTETAYPEMPTISSLPGTTASPIRIPYGNGRGELIDLPGINRSSLDTYVRPEFHEDMIMQSRVVPERHTIKPGQSILLGGLIRITPKLRPDDELIFLAYPFLPSAFTPHVTSNSKALGIQTGYLPSPAEGQEPEPYAGTIQSNGTDEAKTKINSAGTFALKWDVTKARAGPLTAKQAGKVRPDRLAFTVYSADILIEGVGWVELACQVRKRWAEDALSALDPVSRLPEVEIFSPEGKYVGIRRPMNGFLLGGRLKSGRHAQTRGRQPIGMKKRQASSQRAGRSG